MTLPEADRFLGKRIREYEVLEVLGHGGMGSVYRARHVYLEEERALKVVQPHLATDKSFVDRFIREARLLSMLKSPYLVQLYEFGTLDEHTFFMVMELIRGESALARLRARGRLPAKEAVKIVREAALGLELAHSKGIVHRDISPDNLLLVSDETGVEITKVIDFGIAKPLFGGMQATTATNVFVGKLEYASPEHCGVLEAGETIDARSDVYSLGVTLYNMVTGRLPFHATSPQGYIVKHATEQPKPPSSLLPPGAIPEDLDRVILKALSKKREERQASMAELVRELDRVALKTPVPQPETAVVAALPAIHPGTNEVAVGVVFAGRYAIEGKLGEGGMGAVYRATDRILNMPVALKVIGGRIAHDRKALERLKREVILARRVAHPHVCRIHDIGESGGLHYISMELLEGRELSVVLGETGALGLEAGLRIVKQILGALREAHRVGIVHRDLKPNNVMLGPDDNPTIMDFGISFSGDVQRVTQTGAVVGTPHYMAPEQVAGHDVDHRADIYAMGVIMFEIFTGRLPFDAKTPVAVIMAQLEKEPPRPSALVSSFPLELERIILRALAKKPEDRFRTVDELLTALERVTAQGALVGTTSLPPPTEVIEVASGETAAAPPARRPTGPRPGALPAPPTAPPSRGLLVVLVGLASALLVTVLLLLQRGGLVDRTERVLPASPAADTTRAPAPPPSEPAPRTAATQSATVVINALPWARVTIVPVSTSVVLPPMPEEERVTPCRLELPEGEYAVELDNGGLSPPRKETIQVRAGQPNNFSFRMPGYDPETIVKGILASR